MITKSNTFSGKVQSIKMNFLFQLDICLIKYFSWYPQSNKSNEIMYSYASNIKKKYRGAVVKLKIFCITLILEPLQYEWKVML